MKVLLTVGHPYSGFNLVHQALLESGLKSANLFRDEQFSPERLQTKIVEAHLDDIHLPIQYQQLNPSKFWQGLTGDLFVANLNQAAWGWADTNTIYLLNYWRDFDPRTRFILVYASPIYALKELLQTGEVESDVMVNFFEDWLNANIELLSFYNRNKENCVLVNIEGLSKSSVEKEGFASILKTRLGIEVNASIRVASIENDAHVDLFSNQLNQEYPNIETLYQELESVADIYLGDIVLENQRLSVIFQQYAHFKAKQNNLIKGVEQLSINLKLAQEQLAIEKQKPDFSSELKKSEDQVYYLQQELLNNSKRFSKDSEINELKQKNELLLLEMQQIQEELEHYFIQYQKAIEIKPVYELPEQFVVDLREKIEGDNWWNSESDGRWAGPDLQSNIKIPQLKPGLYQLKVEIVDVISSDILKNTQFFINKKSLDLVNSDSFYEIKRLFGLRKRYPIILTTDVSIDNSINHLILSFKFPKVISPSSKGSDDFRSLAIRVKSVELKLLK